VATFVFEVMNQNDEVVQRGRMLVLVRADDQQETKSEDKAGA
jgi:hypothetical protein